MLLDIGGEGRYANAWNLNPSHVKTLGPDKGKPIPHLILGRAQDIPLPDQSVDRIVSEQTPLTRRALVEIARVIAPGGEIVLRHVPLPMIDTHADARRILPGTACVTLHKVRQRVLQETRFQLDGPQQQ